MGSLIQATPAVADIAGGGAVIETNGYFIHTFTNIGTTNFSVTMPMEIDVLVVGGGGGGGVTMGGGGGGGGVLFEEAYALTAGVYTVTVGQGGLGGYGYNNTTLPLQAGVQGDNSAFGDELVAIGGGGGAGWNGHPPTSGGSGGGGNTSTTGGTPGAGTAEQGYGGGTGNNTVGQRSGGGGGGAGAFGANGVANAGGKGGDGREVFGTYYGGGGGGGVEGSALNASGGGAGGLGGGGAGSRGTTSAIAGIANTGGGGGGSGYDTARFSNIRIGGKGGSGIVIVRYQTPRLTVISKSAAAIGPTNALISATVYGTEEPDSAQVYLCWDTADRGTNAIGHWAHSVDFGTGWVAGQTVSTNLFTLESGSNYACRAYAVNSTGESWSTLQSFQTAYLPAVTNLGSIDGRVLTWLRGEVTDTGAQPPQAWFEWWADGAASTNRTDMGVQSGVFSNALSGLDPDVVYRYRVGASNTAGSVWSHVEEFATLADGWYVTTNGSDSASGTSWAEAFLTVSNALAHAQDDDTVFVSNGVFNLTATLAVAKAIRLTSVNGVDATILRREGPAKHRILNVTHADAIVEGFTIANGYDTSRQGGGIRMTAGTVRQSVVVSNTTYGNYNASSQGGGIYMTGGWIEDCVIRDNWATASSGYGGQGYGGGIYMTGGTVDRCRIIANKTDSSSGLQYGNGGGVYMTGGTLRNTLVVSNSGPSQAGGVYITGAATIVEQVTVAYNTARTVNSGGVRMLNGTLRNAIVYYNRRTMDSAVANIDQTGGTITYTCATPEPAGIDNIATAPDFVDPTAGNFRLLWGSPCIDNGMELAHVTLDLDAVERPQDGSGDGEAYYDMGAYERLPPDDPLLCNFTGDPTESVGSTEVVFTAQVVGTNTNGLYYWWDFNTNGFADIEGLGLAVVSNEYQPGLHSVRLTVSNAAGAVATEMKTDYIHILPDTVYVATNGSHTFPYDTWATAATNLQAAIDTAPASGTVVVAAGVYPMTDAIFILKSLTVQGEDGAAATVISGGLHVNVNHAGVLFEGFTVTGGRGISMTGGIVRDCIVSNNYIYSTTFGGGVTMTAGLLERCMVRHNHVYSSYNGSSYGGGLRISGGMALNCEIAGNQATSSTSYGGMSQGGGVYMSGSGVLVNCTVTGNGVNKATSLGGGLYHTGSSVVTNTIIWDNRNLTTDVTDDLGGTFPAGFSHSCAPELTSGTGNIDVDPEFRETGSGYGLTHAFGDYRLGYPSSCLDAGWTFEWMNGTTDLQGLPRVLWSGAPGGAVDVDMGAYETPPLRGTMIRVR